MTGEEAKAFLIDISYDLGTMGVEHLSVKDGKKMRDAIKALEQETVSKESYDHEYFLRKELEMKIDKLEQQEPIIDKIRAEIRKKMQFNSFNEGYVLYDDITEVLDKHKVESEDKE